LTILPIVKPVILVFFLLGTGFAAPLNVSPSRNEYTGAAGSQKIAPGAAALRAAIFPGWGQYKNGAEIKAGALATVQFIFIAESIRQTLDIESAFELSRIRGETSQDLAAGNAPHYERYSKLFDKRTDLFWLWGLLYFFAVTDAYVDAYLLSFDDEMAEFPYIEGKHDENSNQQLKIGVRFKF